MTTKEFSDGFDTLVNSYRRFKDFDKMESLDSLDFNEYEKSVYLTKAQLELVVSLYSGKNQFGDSFERTEELRRYLDSLVKTVVRTSNVAGEPVDSNSMFYKLPDDIAYITLEQVTYSQPGTCWDGKRAGVIPVRQDRGRHQAGQCSSAQEYPYRYIRTQRRALSGQRRTACTFRRYHGSAYG